MDLVLGSDAGGVNVDVSAVSVVQHVIEYRRVSNMFTVDSVTLWEPPGFSLVVWGPR